MELVADNEETSWRLAENLLDIPFAINEALADDNILKPKQKEAIGETAARIFEEGCRAVATIMPTATGKMVSVARIIAALKVSPLQGRRQKRVLFACDGITGINQAKEKLALFGDIEPALYYGESKNIGGFITLTTFNSWQGVGFPINPQDIDLIILDEAHLAISPARLETLKKYTNAIWWALTASPDYSDERSVLQHYELGYRMNIRDAVYSNLISSFRNILLQSDISVDLDEIGITSRDNYEKRSLARALNTEARNRIGAEYLLFGVHTDTGELIKDLRGVISCVDTDHARDVTELYNELFNKYFPGEAPEHGFVRNVDSYMNDRHDVLKWHKEGKIKYLAFADMLIHNYDDPGISLCLNLRLSRSKVLTTQRGGRAGRIDKQKPGKVALIVDVLDQYSGLRNKKLPLLYAEAIGEVALLGNFLVSNVQPPTPCIDAWSWGNKYIFSEEIRELVWKNHQRLITNEETILAVINQFKSYEIPVTSENYLTARDVCAMTELSYNTVRITFDAVREEWNRFNASDKSGQQPKIPIRQVRTNDRSIADAIFRADWEIYKATYLANKLFRTKTAHDLTIKDVVRETGLRPRTVEGAFEKLSRDWGKYYIDPVKVPKPVLPFEYVKDRADKNKRKIVITDSNWDVFRKEYLPESFVPDKKPDDLSVPEIAKKVGLSEFYIRSTFKKINEEWAQFNAKRLSEPPVLKTMKVKETGKNKRVLEVIPSTLWQPYYELLIKRLKAPMPTDQHLTIKAIAKKTGLSSATITVVMRKLSEEWALYYEDPVTNNKPDMPVLYVKVQNLAYAIYASDWPYFVKRLPELNLPTKGADDLDAGEIEKLSGYTRSRISEMLHDLYRESKRHPAKDEAPAKLLIDITLVRDQTKGIERLTVHRSQIEDFIKRYLPNAARAKTENELTCYDIAELTGLGTHTVRNVMRMLDNGWQKYNTSQETAERPPVEIAQVRLKWKRVLAIFKKDYQVFYDLYLSEKVKRPPNQEDYTIPQLAQLLEVDEREIKRAFDQISTRWKEYCTSPSSVARPEIEAILAKEKGKRSVRMLLKKDFPRFAEIYFTNRLKVAI